MRVRTLFIGVGMASTLALSPAATAAAQGHALAPAPAAQPGWLADPSALVVFSDRAAAGRRQSFGTGVFDAASGGLGAVGNDQITSLRVADGYRVIACDHAGTEGRVNAGSLGLCRYFDTGQHDHVGDDLNDRISLLAVVAGPAKTGGATAYRNSGLSGAKLKLGPGGFEEADGDLGKLPATVRSLKLDDGFRAVACDNDRRNGMNMGTCRLFTTGGHATVGADLEGIISLVAVGGPALAAASDAGLTSRIQTFGPGVHTAGTGTIGLSADEAISSLRVADGYRVLACAQAPAQPQPPAGEACKLFGAGTHELARTRFDNELTALAVLAGPSTGSVITGYRDLALAGPSKAYGPGLYTAADLAGDPIGSLQMSGGAHVIICLRNETAARGLGACRHYPAGDTSTVAELDGEISIIAISDH